MRPDYSFAAGAVKIEQPLERVEHMLIAQVPRIDRTVIHDAVIALGIGRQSSVFHGVEKAIAVAFGILKPMLQHVAEHLDYLFFAIHITAA